MIISLLLVASVFCDLQFFWEAYLDMSHVYYMQSCPSGKHAYALRRVTFEHMPTQTYLTISLWSPQCNEYKPIL